MPAATGVRMNEAVEEGGREHTAEASRTKCVKRSVM